jgi:hypothetical protein
MARPPTIKYDDIEDAPVLSLVATSGDYNDLANRPVQFSGDYNDLTNKPDLTRAAGPVTDYNKLTGKPPFASIATSGSYLDLADRPSLSKAAFTGEYTDLLNIPYTVPTSMPPKSNKGEPGDMASDIAFDPNYFYYCVADYVDGTTNIWRRIPHDRSVW